jgi:hypothetical protein
VCSAEPRCFVSDRAGTVFTSTNPNGGVGAWTVTATTPPFHSGSCPTTNLCVTVNGQEIATTTNPSAGAWTTLRPISEILSSVSCPSASLCVAVGLSGALDVTTDSASRVWTHTTIDNGSSLTWVSCASTALCVATDSSGHVLTSTDPTGGPSAWNRTLVDGDPCDDTTPCGTERIEASDATGVHTVDSIRYSGYGIHLTGLGLNGDTLGW